VNALFARIAKRISMAVGSPFAFILAAGAIIAWAVSGFIFGYSSNWQLVVNTGTTIVTFLMVFIIQNAQNRDEKAVQLKLDELLRATNEAKTGLVRLEELDDETIAGIEKRFRNVQDRHLEEVEDMTGSKVDKTMP
jgi:low affinity Fe/Cu permease